MRLHVTSNKFRELRKVRIQVDGNYLKAKMLKYVAQEMDVHPKKGKDLPVKQPILGGSLPSIRYNIEGSSK